jgi:uncharacterized protein YbjT (DUF2867 family)
MKHVVIAGASGLLGSNLLNALLESQKTHITSLVRTHQKHSHEPHPYHTEVLFDFNDPAAYKEIGTKIACDVFFCCLGTTLAQAKSFKNFLTVEREYPLHFIQTLKTHSPQTLFVFSSSVGASNPRGYYLNAKCDVEKALTQSLLPYIIVRPSVLLGHRKNFRLAEKIGGFILKKVDHVMKKLSLDEHFAISKLAPIEAHTLAQSMVFHALNFDKTLPGMVLEGKNLNLQNIHKP